MKDLNSIFLLMSNFMNQDFLLMIENHTKGYLLIVLPLVFFILVRELTEKYFK